MAIARACRSLNACTQHDPLPINAPTQEDKVVPFHPSTRLICTIGNSSRDVETLKALLASGMSVSVCCSLLVAACRPPPQRWRWRSARGLRSSAQLNAPAAVPARAAAARPSRAVVTPPSRRARSWLVSLPPPLNA